MQGGAAAQGCSRDLVKKPFQRVEPRPVGLASHRLQNRGQAAQSHLARRCRQSSRMLAGTVEDDLERPRQRVVEANAKLRQLRAGYRKEEIAQAKSALEAAQAKVQRIRTQLDETVIKSPVDALVEAMVLQTGDLVDPGKPVATLLRTGSLWVRAYLPEAQLRFVHPGDRASIRVDSFPDRSFSGGVRRIHRQGGTAPRNAQTDEALARAATE